VERSDTHQLQFEDDGCREGLDPSYALQPSAVPGRSSLCAFKTSGALRRENFDACRSSRHCEERLRRNNPDFFRGPWIASLTLAMTAMGGMRAAPARPMSGGDAAPRAGNSEIKLKHG
jgi:hypothetical protein